MLSVPYMIWLHFYIQTSIARYAVEMVRASLSYTIVLSLTETHVNFLKRIGVGWLY